MVTRLGLKTLAALNASLVVAIGVAQGAMVSLSADIGAIQGRLASILSYPTQPPPNILQLAAAAASFVTSYNPAEILATVSAQLAGVQAELSAKLALQAGYTASLNSILSAISAGVVTVYTHEGPAANFGAEIGPFVASDLAPKSIKTLVLATDSEVVWAAMKTIFGV